MAQVATGHAGGAESGDGPGGTGLRGVARGGLLNLVGAVVSTLLNVLIVVAVTRGFSQAEAGVFFSATSVFLIVLAAANLGTSTGLVYFISGFRARRATGLIPRLLRVSLTPVAVVSALVAAAMYAWADPLAGALVTGDSDTAHTADYVRMLALFIPFAVISEAALAGTRGFRDMRATVLLDKIGRPTGQVVLLAAVALGGSAGLLAVAWAGPYLPVAVLAGWWLWRLTRRAVRAPQPAGGTGPEPSADARTVWGFTAPRSIANIAQMGIQRLGIVLVAALEGAPQAALFTAATRFVVVGQFGQQAIGTAVQPRLAEQLAVGERAAAKRLYQVSTAWLVLVTWPLYWLSIVFAPLALSLFGEGYQEGKSAMVLMSAAMLLASGCGIVDAVLTMAGRTGWNLANNLAALAVSAGLSLLLIPTYGGLGAAIGWAAAIAVRNLLPLFQLARHLRLHPFSAASGVACALSTVWFGVLPFAVRAAAGDGLLAAAGAVLAGGAGTAASLWYFRRTLHLDEFPLPPALARRFGG
ncbi:MAG: polysaccharide biosynthesis protein [Streptosporangiales bacterium]|nr:polysaccharide biosynthesis protein [Streptosporangiales bacterium]